MRATLVSFQEIAPGVRHFVFAAPELIEFTPGQFVSLSAEINGEVITRAYSLASSPATARRDNRFELCLNLVDGGVFSPYLFKLNPGDSVAMGAPLGTFTLRQPVRDSIFIATGTGIAPFRSMLPAALNEASVTLLFGVRYESHLLYRTEFEAMNHQEFRFWPTLTRADEQWTGRTGRVQSHLVEAIGGRADLDVYLCGMKAMVDDVRAILKTMGFDRKQIRSEKYD